MREVDAVGSREVDIGHRHVRAFNLAERIAKLELGHVLAAGQLSPAGFAANLRSSDVGPTARAAQLSGGDLGAAPGADRWSDGGCYWSLRGARRRLHGLRILNGRRGLNRRW